MTLAIAQTTTVPWGYRAYCREHHLDLRGFSVRANAQEAADDHNRNAHTEELQLSRNNAAIAWVRAGARGHIPAESFPLWGSPSCLHRPVRQYDDGEGTICLDCGRIRVIA